MVSEMLFDLLVNEYISFCSFCQTERSCCGRKINWLTALMVRI